MNPEAASLLIVVLRQVSVVETGLLKMSHRLFTGMRSVKNFASVMAKMLASIGSIIISVPIPVEENQTMVAKTVHIGCDVVRSRLPLLSPKAAMLKMNASIHFGTNVLCMGEKTRARLTENAAGHIQIPAKEGEGEGGVLSIAPSNPTKIILAAQEEKGQPTLAQLAKIHLQLSHCTEEVLLEVIQQAGRT